MGRNSTYKLNTDRAKYIFEDRKTENPHWIVYQVMDSFVSNDQMCKDNTQLRRAQRQRRDAVNLESQELANRIKSEYCDQVKSKRGNELNTTIMGLYDTDRKLYNYLRNLENICGSIWCAKCSDIIPLPKLPESLLDEIEVGLLSGYGLASPTCDEETKKYKGRLEKMMMVCDELKAKVEILSSELDNAGKQITALKKKNTLLGEQMSALHDIGHSATCDSASGGSPPHAAPHKPEQYNVPIPLPNLFTGADTITSLMTKQTTAQLPQSSCPAHPLMFIPVMIPIGALGTLGSMVESMATTTSPASTAPTAPTASVETPVDLAIANDNYMSEEDFAKRFSRKEHVAPDQLFDIRSPSVPSSVFFSQEE